jgi:PAS domain S-box-containing protein
MVSLAAGVVVVLVGYLVLVGWWFDVAALKSVLPGLVTMKANTAAGFVLAGVSLLSSLNERAGSWGRRLARILAAAVALLGLLTLCQYLLGTDLGLDQLLFTEPADAIATSSPGRMAPVTAISFLLVGSALFLVAGRRSSWLVQLLVLMAGAISLLALVGYACGVESLYGVAPFTSLALHTAAAFLVLCFGIINTQHGRGLLAVMTSDSLGGAMARRLLPAAVLVPVALGWLRLAGQRVGLYGTEFGLALFAISNIAVFTLLIWLSARSLDRADKERKQGMALAASEERFQLAARATNDIIYDWDFVNRTVWWNNGIHAAFGYQASDVPPSLDWALERIHPEDRDRMKEGFLSTVERGGGQWTDEYRFLRADGSYADVLDRGHIVYGSDGKPVRVIGAMMDISERKQAEEKFRALLESAPDAMVIVDGSGKIVLVNAQTERLFGYRREELEGRPLDVLIPERHKGCHEDACERYFGSPHVRMGSGLDLPGRRKDASEFPADICLSPLRTRDGLLVIAAVRDITERREVEQELERRAARLQEQADLLDLAHDAIIVRDLDGRIVSWNNGAARTYGWQKEEAIGQISHEFLQTPPQTSQEVDAELASKGRWEGELVHSTKDGGRIVVASRQVLHAGPGRRQEVLEINRDITAYKQAEQQLKLRAQELARSNDELERFAYIASHDLQEPLRKIRAFGDRLREEWGAQVTGQGLDYLERMQNAARRMQTLISDLLKFSRVGRKQTFTEVNLGQVTRDVLSDLQVSIDECGARVIVGDLPTILADATQMRQLLQNLVSNALKFRRKEEPPLIKVYSSEAGEFCHLFVEDNGIGFDERYLDRIFAPFQRLHSRNDYQGTGIGLAICRKIAERHGGSITARSAPGGGATFIVALPLRH